MDEQTLRILFTNTVLIANADGRVAPEERGFLNEFAVRAGITAEQMQTWLGEIREGRAEFQALEGEQHREALFALMIGTVSSDGELSAAERDALLRWGHVLGLSPGEVRDKAKTLWREDVLASFFPETAPVDAPVQTESADTAAAAPPDAVVISNGFEALDAMLKASPEVAVSVTSMGDAADTAHDVSVPVFFHAHEEREGTLEMLEWVRRRYGEAPVVVVLNRHQAFQISYLYEAEVARCLVEPVYPGELTRVLNAVTQ